MHTLLYRLYLLLLVPFFSTAFAGQVLYQPPSDWIQPPDNNYSQQLPSSDAPVRYIKSDQQYNLVDDGITYYHQLTLQVLNQKGLEQSSELEFGFNEHFETLTIHEINIIRNGKTENRLVQDEVKVFRTEEELDRRILNGSMNALVVLKDVRIGDIIEYSYSIEGFNPIFGEKRFGSFITQWSVPVETIQLKLHTKDNQKVYFNDTGEDYTLTRTGDKKIYSWNFDNVEGVFEEGEYPSWFNPYSYIEFSEYRNWAEVRAWAEKLYQTTELSDDIVKLIAQWKAESSSTKEVLGRALQFVQDEIRYFGLELGENTHRPNPPPKVFESRFGDCKDKTLLLHAIYKHLGVKSSPALVSSRQKQGLEQRLPSPGAFDHVILNVDYDNQEYWLDGTISHQRGGIDKIGFINPHRALVLNNRDNELTKVSGEDFNKNATIKITEEFKVESFLKPALLTITTVYTGIHADQIRYQFANSSNDEIVKQYVNYYSRFIPEIKSTDAIAFSDNEQENQVTVVEKYSIKDWSSPMSGKWVVSLSATSVSQYLYKPQVVQRTMPYRFANNVNIKHVQKVQLPETPVIHFSEEDVHVTNDNFKYQRKSKLEENLAVVEHSYLSTDSSIMPKEMPSFLTDLKSTYDSLDFQFVSVGKSKASVKKEKDKLKNLVKGLMDN